MSSRLTFWLVFFSCVFLIQAQPIDKSDSVHSVYLFGNLTDLADPAHFFTALETEIRSSNRPFSILVAGDMVNASYEKFQIKTLKELITLVGKYSTGKLIMIPGDRDWKESNDGGFKRVKKLEDELKKYAKKQSIKNFEWPVKNGCPGPFDLYIDEHVELIAMNSQWWNHPFDKPRPADAECKYVTKLDINEELNDLIEDNKNKNVLLVGHHPIKSLGNYGGRFSFSDHLKPFPLIGTLRNSFKANIGGVNDLVNEQFLPYKSLMENAIFLNHNLIYASAHEKNQQILKMGNNYYINSGALTNPTFAASDYTTEFSAKKSGIMRIDYYKDGQVSTSFLQFNNTNELFEPKHEQLLFASACDIDNLNNPSDRNLSYIPCKIEKIGTKPENVLVSADTSGIATISAGKKYDTGWFNRLWMGNRYREDWASPIQVPFIDIDTTFNGLQAIKRGGGRQTFSLKFRSESGDVYTFRSVDKDPAKSLDYSLRETIISKLFRDQTSGQQPYGALVISTLLNHLDILHATPQLYVMPDVKALGPFQDQYGGMLGLLEEAPGKKNSDGKYFADADDILKSNELFRKMFKDEKHKVKTEEFVRARIFDIWVGDWSKHEDNWKWAAFKKKDTTIYRPIPRDRDMVFSRWDGILPSIADMPFGAPNTEGFDHKIKGFKSLVYQARYMDRFLLTEVPRTEFLKQAKFIQDQITEVDIEAAVRRIPKASFDLSGADIISKLKQRKTDLVHYAEKYYNWLNEEIELVGTKDDDLFEVETLEDGKVKITILEEHKKKDFSKYYERIFDPSDTKRIKIYGLGEKDKFDFKNEYQSDIKLVLLGGKGEDKYKLPQDYKGIKIYDLNNLDDSAKSNLPLVKHWNHEIYAYERDDLKFNSWLPSALIGYTNYQGYTLELGNTWTRQRWDKEDYASKHTVKSNFSTLGTVGFQYYGRWHHAIRKWDLLADLTIANPQYFNNFYGLGNGTVVDRKLENQDFYVANYNQYVTTIGVARIFWRRSEFSLKTGIGSYTSDPVDNSILDGNNGQFFGADGRILAIPTSASLDVDLRDHKVFPTKGMRMKLSGDNYYRLDGSQKTYGTLNSSIEYLLSNYWMRRVTLGVKVAATKGYGTIPYFHQPTLGSKTGLRGYPRNRFTGKSLVYLNSEIRVDLFNQRKASIPIRVGLIGFYDTGRVFLENNSNEPKKLQFGYGTGFYIIPFSRSFAMSFVVGWSDERSFYPTFKFGTFLN